MIDAVAKRQLVVTIFILIQSIKLFDWWNLRDSILLGLLLKWAIIETAFLLALWMVKVPRLSFTLVATIVISALLFALNSALLAGFPYAIHVLRLKHMSLSSATVDLVGAEADTIDDIAGSREQLLQGKLFPLPRALSNSNPTSVELTNESHLQGTFSVKIRPWSSAELGVAGSEASSFCIPHSTAMPNSGGLSETLRRPVNANSGPPNTKIPLHVRGNGPWTVKISRNGKPYRESLQIKPSTSSLSSKMLSVSSVDSVLVDVEVDQVGLYSVSEVLDGNGVEGKIEGDPVEVRQCPQMRFDGILVKTGIEMCTGSVFPVKVWLEGEAPFSLTFDIISDSGVSQLFVPQISPSTARSSNFNLYTYNLNLSSTPSLAAVSQFLLRAASVHDASGRVHKYGTWDNGDAILVDTASPPRIKWLHHHDTTSSGGARPPKILDDGKAIALAVELVGKAPFEYSVQRSDGQVISMKDVALHQSTILAAIPGPYKLISVNDSLCTGSVDLRDELAVQIAHAPTVTINSEPIKGPCKGDMGLNFVFLLTGEGPWRLFARQKVTPLSAATATGKYTTGKSKEFVIDVSTPRFEYSWRPEVAGSYQLEIFALADENYELVTIRGHVYEQDTSPAPTVNFAVMGQRESSMFTCVGQAIDAGIRFSGIGPWILQYSLIGPDKNIQNMELLALNDVMEIKLEDLRKGGRYTLSLLSVTDGTGCQASVVGQSKAVTVFEHLPAVEFPERKVIIREGFDDLVPLKVRANTPPVQVGLKFEAELEGAEPNYHSLTIDSTLKGLSLNAAGRWTLMEVRDKYCWGHINADAASTTVFIVPKPTVAFVDGIPKWTSRSPTAYSPPSVLLSGAGNIVLTFSMQYALDEAPLASAPPERKILTGTNGQALALLSGKVSPAPGFYRFELISISDSSFPEMALRGMTFIQQILPDPAPRIASAARTAAFCYDSSDSAAIGPFVLDFTGSELKDVFPIKLKYDLTVGSHPSATGEVEVGEGRLFHIKRPDAPGSYHLRAIRAENSLGGVWDFSGGKAASHAAQVKDQSAIIINLVEKPSFKLSATNLCVGDVAHFEFFGSGPWTLNYKLNKRAKSDTASNDRLNVLLAEAGSLTIDSLCNKHCCADLSALKGTEFAIHSLPSASISEGTRYVREGEETEFVVAFRGTPPFAYSYQRIDDTDGRIIDTVSFDGINGTEHHVKVSSQGTFKVVHVQDQFCQYPKRDQKIK